MDALVAQRLARLLDELGVALHAMCITQVFALSRELVLAHQLAKMASRWACCCLSHTDTRGDCGKEVVSTTSMPFGEEIMEPPLSMEVPDREIRVSIEKSASADSAGIRIQHRPTTIFVHSVSPGPIADWNLANPALAVGLGDQLVEVNGVTGPSTEDMLVKFKTDRKLELVFVRARYT